LCDVYLEGYSFVVAKRDHAGRPVMRKTPTSASSSSLIITLLLKLMIGHAILRGRVTAFPILPTATAHVLPILPIYTILQG